MATGYIEINGTEYQIFGEFEDDDPNFAAIDGRARSLVEGGGPGMVTFEIDKGGVEAELHVAAEHVITAAAWLKPDPTVHVF